MHFELVSCTTNFDFERLSGPIGSGRKQAGKVSLVGSKPPVTSQMRDPVKSQMRLTSKIEFSVTFEAAQLAVGAVVGSDVGGSAV